MVQFTLSLQLPKGITHFVVRQQKSAKEKADAMERMVETIEPTARSLFPYP
jgi:hypothetical protein